MSDSKMTNNYALYIPAECSQDEQSVVKSLDIRELYDVDAENKIRTKLQEFAAELQTIKADQGIL